MSADIPYDSSRFSAEELPLFEFKPDPLKYKFAIDAIDDSKVIETIVNLTRQSFGNTPVVFTQSHSDGSLVMKGTKVDLVLVPRKHIKFGIFKGAHKQLAEKSIADLEGFIKKDLTREIFANFEKNNKVTEEDKGNLATVLGEFPDLDFVFDGDTPNLSWESFIKTLINARPFYENG